MTRVAYRFVRPLAAVDRTMVAEVGGKAAPLGELLAAGLPVPDGFVLCWPSGADDAPAELLEELRDAYAALCARTGHPRVAVRSSGVLEDREAASFAGLYETFLNVQGADDVVEAALACARSARGEGVERYRRFQRIEGAVADGFAVLVQELVPAEVAGVAFSVDPVTRDDTRLVVDAALGLGLSVVSGTVVPDHFVLDRESLAVLEHRAGRQAHAVEPHQRGTGTVERALPARDGAPVLEPGQLAELARVVLEAERRLGAPQDVEWAIHAGAVHLLQSRPITVGVPSATGAKRPAPDELPWDSARERGAALIEELAPDGLGAPAAARLADALERATSILARDLGVVDAPLAAELGAAPPSVELGSWLALGATVGAVGGVGLDPRIRGTGRDAPLRLDGSARRAPVGPLAEGLVERLRSLLDCAEAYGELLELETGLATPGDCLAGVGSAELGASLAALDAAAERLRDGDPSGLEALLPEWLRCAGGAGWGECGCPAPGAVGDARDELHALLSACAALPAERRAPARLAEAIRVGEEARAALLASAASSPRGAHRARRVLERYVSSVRALVEAGEGLAKAAAAELDGTETGAPGARADRRDPSPLTPAGAFERRARGAAGGRGHGPLRRVVGRPRLDALAPGDVVWTPVAARGWAPYLPLLAGFIVDSGAPLAQGVLAARELALPTVIGAGAPPAELEDGRVIEIDGSSGALLARPPAQARESR